MGGLERRTASFREGPLAIPFLLALFVTLAMLWQIQRLVRTSQWVEHTDQVISQTNQLLREIVDLQTALRGYVITNDPSFLNPQLETRVQIFQSIAQLKVWTKDNPPRPRALQRSKIRQFAALLVPELADWCALCMPDSQGHLRMEASAHFDPQKQSALQELAVCHVPQALSAGSLNRVVQTGKAEVLPQVGDEFVRELSADPEVRSLFHKLGMTLIATLPLEAHGRVLGAIAFIYGEPGRQFHKEDMPFYEEVARRAALSIDKARLYREAQDAIRVREEVISALSHDLRDPLNTIVLNATLLDRLQSGAAVKDPTLDKLTDGIIRSAKLMQRLILGLLDMAKLQAGTFALHRRSCTVSSLFVELGEIVRPLAQQKALTMKGTEDSTPIKIYCDCDRILQVLANVVSNAIKFTPSRGFIEITAKRQNEIALFAVKDTGPGLSQEHLIHMFDRNWQARETAALGTGLGLWIAKSVVEAHGENIWAESVLDQGVTVFFTIPTTEMERENPASN